LAIELDKRKNAENGFLFFSGILLGVILGVFGNMYASYLYDMYKNQIWFYPFVTLILFAFIAVMGYALLRFRKQMKS
jgi:uncharacterized membrane protein YeaQ/YmgE (transglycosylase-associated protein family)